MPWATTNDPMRFQEAADWFQGRIPITKGWYEQLALKWRRYTFTVAGVAQLTMVAEVQQSLHQAILDGTHLREWKKAMLPFLENEWAGSVKRPGFRASTIWRNNLQHAYNTGRWQVHTDPAVLAARPYWLYDAIMDDRTTPECIHRNGTILHHSDPWWNTNYPPNHHRCRAAVRTLREADAKARGISNEAPNTPAQRGWGAAPHVDEWNPDPADFPQKLFQVWEKKLATMTPMKPPLGPPAPPTGTPYDPTKTPAPQPIARPQPKGPTKPAPKAAPATGDTTPVGPPPLRDTILGRQTGAARGSNTGGFWEGTDGVTRYVKEYTDPSQAYGEHLANQLYRSLGIDAPESIVFELADGRLAYASIVLPGDTLATAGLTKARANALLNGFGGDVLTGNWDAVGLNLDNILVDGKRLIRIDNGGTFLMRARAGRKPAHLLNDITEWTAFLDPARNPAYAKVAKAAGVFSPEDLGTALVAQLDRILKLEQDAGGWAAFVNLHAPGLAVADRKAIVAMLEARTKLLAQQRTALQAALTAPKPVIPTAAPGTEVFDATSGTFRQMANGSSREMLQSHAAAEAVDPATAHALSEVVQKWTRSYSRDPYQAALRRQAALIAAGKKPTTAAGRALQAAYQTRAARWQAAAQRAGTSVPGSFRAYRGVSGDQFLQDVYEAWRDNVPEMAVRSREMASWSFSPSGAFSGQVRFDVDLPFHQTVADQVIDDGSFVSSYFSEHEVISFTGRENELVANPTRVQVRVGGRTYDGSNPADRAAFVTGWEQRHGPGGIRSP